MITVIGKKPAVTELGDIAFAVIDILRYF